MKPGRGKKSKWTLEEALLLYRELTARFGPFASWPNDFPADKEAFDEFCSAFALVVHSNSGKAVEEQIMWATTTQGTIQMASSYMRNKMAAFEAGFIGPRLAFPNQMLATYND